MNFDKIADKNLVELAENIHVVERATMVDSLHYLGEIDRRRLFSKLGYSSMYAFAMSRLKHSGDEACRRISAMRLMLEFPSIEPAIREGSLTLTNLNLTKNFFNREKHADRELTKTQKIEFLKLVENKSKREVEKLIAERSPETYQPDRIRHLSETQIELQFLADVKLQDKITRLKGLLAHSHPFISLGELVDMLCDLGIEKFDKSTPAKTRSKKSSPPTPPAPARVDDEVMRPRANASKKEIRKTVWSMANSMCEWCGSQFALEVDHIVPRAKGGSDHITNLRLLCRSCNQRAAIEQFGQERMDPHINRNRAESDHSSSSNSPS